MELSKSNESAAALSPVNNAANDAGSPSSASVPPPSVVGDASSDDKSDEPISPAEKSLLQKIIRKGLVDTTKDLEIQRKDPMSPLYSVKSFEALHLLVIHVLFTVRVQFFGS